MPHTPMKNAASPPIRAMRRASVTRAMAGLRRSMAGRLSDVGGRRGGVQSARRNALRPVYSAKLPRSAVDDLVLERADVLDADLDAVADVQRADASRRAGQNDVARYQRHHAADEAHQRVGVEQHVAGAGALSEFSVDARLDEQVAGIDIGGHPRAERAEAVESLGARPLPVDPLQVARGHVVAAEEPQDALGGLRGRRHVRSASDDHAQFAFVVDAADALGNRDALAGADDGGGRLDEDHRLERGLVAHLGDVVLVVQADADHLGGGHGAQQVRVHERNDAFGLPLGERLVADQGDRHIVCEPVAAVSIMQQTHHPHPVLPYPLETVLSGACFHRRGLISCEYSVNGANGRGGVGADRRGELLDSESPAEEMPYSSASTSASHDASMMFSETPTVPQLCSPSPDSMSTRVIAPVPFFSSRTRTL